MTLSEVSRWVTTAELKSRAVSQLMRLRASIVRKGGNRSERLLEVRMSPSSSNARHLHLYAEGGEIGNGLSFASTK